MIQLTDKQARAIRFIEQTLKIKYDNGTAAHAFIGQHLAEARHADARREIERLEHTVTNAPVWDLAGRRGPDPDRIEAYEYAGQKYPGGTLDFTPHTGH